MTIPKTTSEWTSLMRSPRFPTFVDVILGMFAIIWVCTYKMMDRDFWWHIKAGEIMLQTGAIIRTDPFAFTRSGLPYLATHEWLAQIVLYVLYSLGGSTGIILFRSLVALTAVSLLLALTNKLRFAYVLLAVWAVVITKGSYLERPQLFTFVFFASFILLAFRFLDASDIRVRRNICVMFIVIELLWVNMHGGAALLGCAVLGLLLLQTLLRMLANAPTDMRPGTLLFGTLALSALALVSPPNGFGTIAYLSQLLGDQTIAFIGEWQPRALIPYFLDLWPFFALAIFSLLCGKKHRVFNWLLMLMTIWLSRKAIRHEVLFVYVAIATVFYQLDRSVMIEKIEMWMNRKRLTAAAITLVILVIGTRSAMARSFNFEEKDNLFGLGTFDLARGATDFIEREKITGNMFNTYGIGGYLIWRGLPNRRVFIDGRNVDYGFDMMMKTYAAGLDVTKWKELADEYRLTSAMVDYDAIRTADSQPYSQILDVSSDWTEVYIDDWVAVYLKNIPENQPIIDRLKYAFVTPSALATDDGFEHVSTADMPRVIDELNRMKSSNPEGVKAFLSLATIALRQGRDADVRAYTSQALKLRPESPEPYAILATMYVNEQQWKEAANAYRHLLRFAGSRYPNLNKKYIASIFEKAGKGWTVLSFGFGGSKPPSQKTNTGASAPSLAVNPGVDAVVFNDAGVTQVESGDKLAAEGSFLNALKLNPGYEEAWSNLCALYVSKYETDKAEEGCKRAIAIDPQSADAHYNLALVYYQRSEPVLVKKEALLAKKFGRVTEADQLLLLIRKKKS